VNNDPPTGNEDDPERQRPSRRIDKAFEDVAKLSGQDLPPAQYFQEFLKIVLWGIEAPAGAVWLRSPQGFLQLQCQERIDDVGLDRHKNGRQSHNELLRQAFQTAKPILLEPFGSTGILEGIPAGNPTDFVCYLAPVLLDEKTAVGLLEVWQEPRWDARMKRVHLNYVVQMASYASTYVRNQQSRQSVNQEQLWTQLESFAVTIHSTLDPTIAAYHIANEGRRLIGCDRVSVAIREGKKARIEAVSGSDVVEKRSSQIKLMRSLCEAVFEWDEKLMYRGVKDEGLPPKVHEALDAYLHESQAKLLVVNPLRDPRERDKETKEYRPGKSRSALVMESYDPPAQPEPILARLDVIGRHAASALYNSAELNRIPGSWVWKPILALQEGLGGKARFWTIVVSTIVVLVILGLIFIPYELKLDATGSMQPDERRSVISPRNAQVIQFHVNPGDLIARNQALVEMDDEKLRKDVADLNAKILSARQNINVLKSIISTNQAPAEAQKYLIDQIRNEEELDALLRDQDSLVRRYNADLMNPGRFSLMTPEFGDRAREREPQWMILSGDDFRKLRNQGVTPSDSLFHIGEVNNDWVGELKIPQKNIGQVRRAFQTSDPDEFLEVDLKTKNNPTESYKGILRLKDIAREAIPNQNAQNETEPVVVAKVQITDKQIPAHLQVPRKYLLSGVEVSVRIRCGSHSAGYSLFYGVWEFICEKWFHLF